MVGNASLSIACEALLVILPHITFDCNINVPFVPDDMYKSLHAGHFLTCCLTDRPPLEDYNAEQVVHAWWNGGQRERRPQFDDNANGQLDEEQLLDFMMNVKVGRTSLHLAAEDGHLQVTKCLVEQAGVSPPVKTHAARYFIEEGSAFRSGGPDPQHFPVDSSVNWNKGWSKWQDWRAHFNVETWRPWSFSSALKSTNLSKGSPQVCHWGESSMSGICSAQRLRIVEVRVSRPLVCGGVIDIVEVEKIQIVTNVFSLFMSIMSAVMDNNVSQFKRMHVPDLKTVHTKRGIKCSLYRKQQFVRLCEVAIELQLEVTETQDDYKDMDSFRRTVEVNGAKYFLPEITTILNWNSDLRDLPLIES
ncbi:unnamed protein product [Mytilus coruscus]|uniref:Uncharacterized protein n=1 Tax=Mytilus coruscus TaxID=42192 RepID=A0A6J8C495_MYTCO|nr:unnamed protein product [Mytilus coruscus]